MKIALAGNPNSGKTSLFNALTGSNQYVGNWPGVTVEKKEGNYKKDKSIIIQDLPGIYSLSPYTSEEVVAREYLVNDKPDAIINIVDGANLERNLYLTTQLLELGVPVIIAVNMLEFVEKEGTKVNLDKLSEILKCDVVAINPMTGKNIDLIIEKIVRDVKDKKVVSLPHVFAGSVEHALAHIEESIQDKVNEKNLRWYAIKIFERDEKAVKDLTIDENTKEHLYNHIDECEKELSDEAISIIINQRYEYIDMLMKSAVIKKRGLGSLSTSDRIDEIMTNKVLALPIFAIIMFLVYYIAMGPIGTYLTDFMNNTLFGDIINKNMINMLTSLDVAPWLIDLLTSGIISGVGTVISFVPQITLLFIFISILEDSGYMSRVAFIFDRLFRKFGLSGKSFIPMLIGTGCGVPAIMATRTIEAERDRRMTILLATFIPCAAKMEIVLIITSAFFKGNPLIATAMYFIGIFIVVISGIVLKKFSFFEGEPAPFIMELPNYHMPSFKNVAIHVWDRVKDFIVKAGTIIFIACVVLWFLMNFDMSFRMVPINESILKKIGEVIAIVFAPLGFGHWQGAVASVSAEVAKEQATATLGLIAGASGNPDLNTSIRNIFNNDSLAAFSFMLFNVFDAPCMSAIATAIKEQRNFKWGFFTIMYQMLIGYVIALITYQIGSLILYGRCTTFTFIAIVILVIIIYLIFRKKKQKA